MTKRQYDQYTDRKMLQENGWQLNKASRYHSAKETVLHSTLKTLAGHYLQDEYGYKVAHEVKCNDGIADLLAYGLEDRISPIVVEIETNAQDDVLDEKFKQYCVNEPVQELYVIDPIELPSEGIMPAYEWVSENI